MASVRPVLLTGIPMSSGSVTLVMKTIVRDGSTAGGS
jgi:hypothetical protein